MKLLKFKKSKKSKQEILRNGGLGVDDVAIFQM